MKLKNGITEECLERVNYALSKQVPDMSRGFVIHTNYGDVEVSAIDAKPFADLATTMLLAKVYS